MKKNKFLTVGIIFLFPIYLFSQIQIGADLDGEAAGDNFGDAVAISADGKRIAIASNAHNEYTGHVKIFDEENGVWTQVGNNINGENIGDTFGWSVALSFDGKRLAVGATQLISTGITSGYVKIFEEINNSWVQVGNKILGELDGDGFGSDVALSNDGSRLAVSARNSSGGLFAGQVRIFDENNGTWTQTGDAINGEAPEDESGGSISISSNGKRIAIGALFNDGNGESAGHVRIFRETINGEWVQIGNDIDGEAAGDYSGSSVSLSNSGKRIAIGAPENSGNGLYSGQVRIFEENNLVWTQIGVVYGEAAGNALGRAVTLSGDGTRLAAGATNDSANNISTGHVRIFKEENGEWSQLGDNIYGEANHDGNGVATAISKDGLRIVIGAYANDGNGMSAGHARVFGDFLSSPTSVKQIEPQILIFPNPTLREVMIKIDKPSSSKIKIRIINQLGELILEKQITNVAQKINELISIDYQGIFWVGIEMGEKVYYQKIIVID